MSRTTFFFVSLIGAVALPLLAHAQEDMRFLIEAAVRGDSHAAGLSDAQVNALVDELVAEAARQGMTAEDMVWRPTPAAFAATGYSSCGAVCTFGRTFGLDDSTAFLMIWLGVSALTLLFLIGAMLEYRHFRHLHPKHASRADVSAVPQ